MYDLSYKPCTVYDFFDKQLRIVHYARASTKKMEQYFSIQDQVSANINFIENRPNWTLIDNYVEHKSGRKMNNRKQFLRLIKDAHENKFDLIIIRDTSRFARNLKDAINVIDELKVLGIGVYYILEGIYSLDERDYDRLVQMSLNAQRESDRKKEYTEMSIRFRKSKGFPTLSPRTTGYKLIQRGRNNPNTFEYNEFSKLVAEIFYMYKGNPLERPEGIELMPGVDEEWLNTYYSAEYTPYNPRTSKSLKQIRMDLNKRGVPTVFNSKSWQISTISSILHKVVYTGYFMYDITEYDERQDRRIKKCDIDVTLAVTAEGEIVDPLGLLHEGDWLPIITLRDWLEIQNALRGNRLYLNPADHPAKGIGKKPSNDIYIRRSQCALCGGVYKKTRSRSNNENLLKPPYIFQCVHRTVNGTNEENADNILSNGVSCSSKSFERIKLDYATIRVFELIYGELKEAIKITQDLLLENYVSTNDVQTKSESKEIKSQLAKVNKNISKIQDDLGNGDIEYDAFKSTLIKLNERKQNLEFQYAEAISRESKSVLSEDVLREKFATVANQIVNINTSVMEVDAELIDMLLIRLVIDSTEEHFKLTYFLDLKGEAYKYEKVSANCFDANYRDNYKLPKDYTIFHSFVITKEEADEYAKSLNKRCFKKNVWNDIEVNIVLDYIP